MGILGRMLGFGGKATMYLQTEKPSYYTGDVVSGMIYLDVQSPIYVDDIVLKCTGCEKCEWEEIRHRTNSDGEMEKEVIEHEGEKKFFKEKITIHKYKSEIPAGQYSYPFSYRLKDDLPSRFKFKPKSHSANDKMEGTIKYKLKATVDVEGAFAQDLKAKQDLIVYQRPPVFEGEQRKTNEGQVMTCCCVPRGNVSLEGSVDKNCYTAGETVLAMARVTNESAVDVEAMRVKLMRYITFRDKHGSTKQRTDTINEAKYGGVPSGETKNFELPMQLSSDLLPSTDGSKIDCAYRIDIECDVPWAPDIEVHIPVFVYEVIPEAWGIVPMELHGYAPVPCEPLPPVDLA